MRMHARAGLGIGELSRRRIFSAGDNDQRASTMKMGADDLMTWARRGAAPPSLAPPLRSAVPDISVYTAVYNSRYTVSAAGLRCDL